MAPLLTSDLARARQVGLLLGAHDLSSPGAIVGWLGAMQAQDLASGIWSLGVRLPHTQLADIEGAIESGEVLRTWPMRGTIHLVPPEDTHWMLDLMASRTLAATVKRREELGLDTATIERAVDVLVNALRGGHRLSRPDAVAVLNDAGIPTAGQAGYHAFIYAAQIGAIGIGPNMGKQQSFVLLDEWAPRPKSYDRAEALTEIAWRYFRSHGPASVADFAGWTGLTLTDSRAGVAANADRLTSADSEQGTVWMSADMASRIGDGLPAQPARALPGFDEFVLGYKDRSAQLTAAHFEAIVPGGNGVFRSTICIDGRAVGTWTRTIRRDRVEVEVVPFAKLTSPQLAATRTALDHYARFLGQPIQLGDLFSRKARIPS